MSEQIHWHEGLFLQPQHLQMLQRQILDRVAADRRVSLSYPYGVVDARLSPDALENSLVRFDRLWAVMPSGVKVDFPDAADLPPLDIKQAFEASPQPFVVYLGVPMWYENRGNAVEPSAQDGARMKRQYRVAERTRTDENTGENAQPVLVRRVNARLMLAAEDRTDLEVMPLMRIARAAGQSVGLPRQDNKFIPPALVLNGSTVLRDLARDLSDQIQASRTELVRQVTHGSGFSIDTMRGKQFEEVMRLQTLNRASARLPNLIDAPGTTPFQMYLELREVLSELTALHPDRDEFFRVAAYNHDNLAQAFFELDEKIRPFLKRMVKDRVWEVPFVKDDRFLSCALTDEHLAKPNEYFLGIKTPQDPRAVAALAEDPDKFKLMAKSLIRQAVWGVRLGEERHPPLDLPSQVGLNYFRLLRNESQRMWEQVKRDKALAVRWPGMETADFALSLYMTVPGGA